MKKSILITLLLCVLSVVNVTAQKFAFIDTEYILNKIPEYKSNQDKIDKQAN